MTLPAKPSRAKAAIVPRRPLRPPGACATRQAAPWRRISLRTLTSDLVQALNCCPSFHQSSVQSARTRGSVCFRNISSVTAHTSASSRSGLSPSPIDRTHLVFQCGKAAHMGHPALLVKRCHRFGPRLFAARGVNCFAAARGVDLRHHVRAPCHRPG